MLWIGKKKKREREREKKKGKKLGGGLSCDGVHLNWMLQNTVVRAHFWR